MLGFYYFIEWCLCVGFCVEDIGYVEVSRIYFLFLREVDKKLDSYNIWWQGFDGGGRGYYVCY